MGEEPLQGEGEVGGTNYRKTRVGEEPLQGEGEVGGTLEKERQEW